MKMFFQTYRAIYRYSLNGFNTIRPFWSDSSFGVAGRIWFTNRCISMGVKKNGRVRKNDQ